MKLSKIAALFMVSVLALCLVACSAPGGNASESASSDPKIEELIAQEPANADEASELYAKLMQKENDILSSDSALWEKVFLAANKDMPMIEDGGNYGDFLLKTIDGAKDEFTADELKTLKAGAQQIKEIEDKLESLEKEFPGCGSTPSAGESVDASTAGMTAGTNASSEATKFPSFTGKDLDGNDVSSDELFSKNKVTVMNFWFTTCKPCVGELGDLEQLNKELAEKGGQVVGVNSFTLDGNKDEIADAKDVLNKKGVTYKNIWFKSDSEAGKFTSNLFSFPTTYVIDQNGKYLLTKAVIDRSARSISYMKVFGYRDKEVSHFYIRSVTLCVVASLVLCQPLIIGSLTAIFRSMLLSYNDNIEIYVPWWCMAACVGIGFATYLLVALMHTRSIRRVSLSEALKVQE